MPLLALASLWVVRLLALARSSSPAMLSVPAKSAPASFQLEVTASSCWQRGVSLPGFGHHEVRSCHFFGLRRVYRVVRWPHHVPRVRRTHGHGLVHVVHILPWLPSARREMRCIRPHHRHRNASVLGVRAAFPSPGPIVRMEVLQSL